MARTRKTIEEQIAEAEKEKAQAAARLSDLMQRQKAEERKRDTRRKVVVGGAVLAHAQHDPEFGKAIRAALRQAVTRDIDKEAIADLLKES